jgi:hypothetical protein
MSSFDTGGPAFPASPTDRYEPGMTMRQYAAIHLKVPNSGDEWLDEMIAASARNDLAAKVLQVALAGRPESSTAEQLVKLTYVIADEMAKAQKGSTP